MLHLQKIKKMKKLLCVLMLMFGLTYGSAQDVNYNAEQGKRLPGAITLNNGEFKEGFIQRYSKVKSQKKVKFFANVDDKKGVEYKPDQVSSYQVADAYYQTLPYEGLTQKTKVFIEKTAQGAASTFTYYIYKDDMKTTETLVGTGNGNQITIDFDGQILAGEMILLKKNGEQLNLSAAKVVLSFKSVMSKYLSECATLATKIANKESGYNLLGLMKILEEYNNCGL